MVIGTPRAKDPLDFQTAVMSRRCLRMVLGRFGLAKVE